MLSAKPLKILFLINRIPFPLNDGGAIGSYNFIRQYAEAGHRVTVLAMNTARHYIERNRLHDTILKHSRLVDVYVDNRITLTGAFFNLFKSKSYVTERFESDAYNKALVELLQEDTFDVVHVDALPPALYIDTIRKYSRALVVMRAHNVEYMIWKRIAEHDTNPIKRLYLNIQWPRLKKFEKEAWQKVDTVLAISREDEQTIRAEAPAVKPLIVPAGMDISDSLPAGNHEVNPLFFIGSLDWMPNLQGLHWFLENIWPVLTKRFPQLKLIIAGKKMPDTIRAYQSASVNCVGEVPDARSFMLNGGVMLVPIVSGSGIRIKIVEAMALGKCIIATTIAAEGLGLTHGENILLADTAQEFEHCLQCILDTPQYAQQIAANAHAFALKHFQNKRIFQQLTHYYRTQLGKS